VEGPSIRLAAEQLRPFTGRRIKDVSGNSRIGIDRLRRQTVREVFAWGKHLVFQFDSFALRIHFLLWGTFSATVKGHSVTGDYRRSGPPRLVMTFANGEITIWSASLRFLEDERVRDTYDFSTDVLSDAWNPSAALARLRAHPDDEVGDVLLDQSIFAGVGNIIKNEILFRAGVNPLARVGTLPVRTLKGLVRDAPVFSRLFLEWRRAFALRANLEIYGKGICPVCGQRIARRVHGTRRRRSFFCPSCQPIAA
jgi:endonuclease-8